MNMSVYPGVDASLRLGRLWTLHASLNTSLRMPSFTEMYYKLQGYAADPHLKPEEMQAIEVGATLNLQRSTFNVVLWHHHGKNMIDWLMDTRLGDQAVWQSVNHTRLNSIGMETTAKFSISKSHFTISYSYINQDKEQEEGIVSQYALEYLRHKLVANAQLQLMRKLSLGIDLRWQDREGSYTDFDGSVQDYRPYFLADARLTWQEKKWKVYVEGYNLLDNHYHDYGLVEQPGLWVIAGVSLRL